MTTIRHYSMQIVGDSKIWNDIFLDLEERHVLRTNVQSMDVSFMLNIIHYIRTFDGGEQKEILKHPFEVQLNHPHVSC